VQPGAGLLTHPGGVTGGPFPLELMTPPAGLPPDDRPWPVASPGPFPDAPDEPPAGPWLAEDPDDDPAVVVIGEEAVVVVDVLPPEPVGEEAVVVVGVAVVVELAEEGAVVVAEPSPGAEAGGAEVVPVGVVGSLTVAGFAAEEDGAAIDDGMGALAASVGGLPAGAVAPAPGCDPGSVALARGSAMPDPGG
jgi:hypothetical protein